MKESRGAIRIAIAILLLGWLLNAVPIAANGGMPLSLWAYRRAGLTETPTPRTGGFYKIVIASSSTRLNFLGDVIPVAAIRQVVSLGDIALIVGIGCFVVASMQLQDRD
jgi:hypothetical protein